MKNELIELAKAVLTGIATKIVLDLVKKGTKKKKKAQEIEIEYKTVIKIRKSTA